MSEHHASCSCGQLRLVAYYVAPAARDTAAVLTVTDEGVGISADDVDAIFQPFRGSFGKGTGLGLAIVHRILSDYGAAIDVQSQPGRGTTFRVSFPPCIERAQHGDHTERLGPAVSVRAEVQAPVQR